MQIILRLLLCLTALVIGSAAILIAVLPEMGAELIDTYQQRLQEPGGRIASGAFGGLLVLIPLAMLLRWYASRRYAREISYATEAGRVAVSLIAIEEALTRAVEQEPLVRKVQIRVYEDRVRRAIIIEAALTLWDDGDVSGVNRRCQQLMRQRFAELMPDETAVQVHLTVHRLSQRRSDDEPRERERSTRETEDSRRASASDDRTPARVPLPGLAATHGGIDNQAGAELLRARRESRSESRGATEQLPRETPPPKAPEEQAAERAEEPRPEEDELYDDLYVGPSYPVDDDEDDSGSQRT